MVNRSQPSSCNRTLINPAPTKVITTPGIIKQSVISPVCIKKNSLSILNITCITIIIIISWSNTPNSNTANSTLIKIAISIISIQIITTITTITDSNNSRICMVNRSQPSSCNRTLINPTTCKIIPRPCIIQFAGNIIRPISIKKYSLAILNVACIAVITSINWSNISNSNTANSTLIQITWSIISIQHITANTSIANSNMCYISMISWSNICSCNRGLINPTTSKVIATPGIIKRSLISPVCIQFYPVQIINKGCITIIISISRSFIINNNTIYSKIIQIKILSRINTEISFKRASYTSAAIKSNCNSCIIQINSRIISYYNTAITLITSNINISIIQITFQNNIRSQITITIRGRTQVKRSLVPDNTTNKELL